MKGDIEYLSEAVLVNPPSCLYLHSISLKVRVRLHFRKLLLITLPAWLASSSKNWEMSNWLQDAARVLRGAQKFMLGVSGTFWDERGVSLRYRAPFEMRKK